MAEYAVSIARSAEKEIERLPSMVISRVAKKIDQLAHNPRPVGCLKLHATHNRWRIRVGDHHVVCAIDDKKVQIDVIAVRHRRFVYE